MFAKKTYRDSRWLERLQQVCELIPQPDDYIYYHLPEDLPVFLLVDPSTGPYRDPLCESYRIGLPFVGVWKRVWGFSVHPDVGDEVRFVTGEFPHPMFGSPLRVEGRWVRYDAAHDRVAW